MLVASNILCNQCNIQQQPDSMVKLIDIVIHNCSGVAAATVHGMLIFITEYYIIITEYYITIIIIIMIMIKAVIM